MSRSVIDALTPLLERIFCNAHVFVVVELVEFFDRFAVQFGRKLAESRRQRPAGLELRVRLEVVARRGGGGGGRVSLHLQLLGERPRLPLVAHSTLDLRQRLFGEESEVGGRRGACERCSVVGVDEGHADDDHTQRRDRRRQLDQLNVVVVDLSTHHATSLLYQSHVHHHYYHLFIISNRCQHGLSFT